MSAQVKTEDVFFDSVTQDRLAGTLFRPASSNRSQPGQAIVLGHGLGAIKEMGLQNYGTFFAQHGYTCLSFDYRHFGHSEGHPRQLLEVSKQKEDWHKALAYIRSLPEVDPEQVGIFGSSFGGGLVIMIAAEDPRVKATISQCPFTSGLHSAMTLSPLSLLPTTAKALADFALGWGGYTINIALGGKPGESALMNAPDVEKGYLNLVNPEDEGVWFHNYVAARFALKILLERPGASASSVKNPILFAICGKDSVAPAATTMAFARQAPMGVIKEYKDLGHFDIYVGEGFDRASKDYIEFLQRQLPIDASGRDKPRVY